MTTLQAFLTSPNSFSELDLSSNQIGDTEAKTLAETLKYNDTVYSLDLSSNHIGDEGIKALAEIIKHNKTIYSLNLSSNQIGNAGAQELIEALKHNNTIHTLEFHYNGIGFAEAKALSLLVKQNKALAEAIKNNVTMHTLDLSGNRLVESKAKALAEALKYNTTIHTLNLKGNEIGESGAKALAEALIYNITIHTLNLNGNQIGESGAKALAEILKYNTTIHTLYCEYNQIGDEGAKALAEILKYNTTIHTLDLRHNQIENAGAKALAEALEDNTTIHTLDNFWNRIGNAEETAINALVKKNNELAKAKENAEKQGYERAKKELSAQLQNQLMKDLKTLSFLIEFPEARTIASKLIANLISTDKKLETSEIFEGSEQIAVEAFIPLLTNSNRQVRLAAEHIILKIVLEIKTEDENQELQRFVLELLRNHLLEADKYYVKNTISDLMIKVALGSQANLTDYTIGLLAPLINGDNTDIALVATDVASYIAIENKDLQPIFNLLRPLIINNTDTDFVAAIIDIMSNIALENKELSLSFLNIIGFFFIDEYHNYFYSKNLKETVIRSIEKLSQKDIEIDIEAINALMPRLFDNNTEVRQLSADTIISIAMENRELAVTALNSFTPLLNTNDTGAQKLIIESIYKISRKYQDTEFAKQSIKTLKSLVSHEELEIRQLSADTIINIAAENKELESIALSNFKLLFNNEDSNIRKDGIEFIKKLAVKNTDLADEAINFIVPLFADNNEDVKKCAIDNIVSIASENTDLAMNAFDKFKKLIKKNDINAINGISQISSENSELGNKLIEFLEPLLDDHPFKKWALDLLGNIARNDKTEECKLGRKVIKILQPLLLSDYEEEILQKILDQMCDIAAQNENQVNVIIDAFKPSLDYIHSNSTPLVIESIIKVSIQSGELQFALELFATNMNDNIRKVAINSAKELAIKNRELSSKIIDLLTYNQEIAIKVSSAIAEIKNSINRDREYNLSINEQNSDNPPAYESISHRPQIQENSQQEMLDNYTGSSSSYHAETSFWYEYSKAAMKQLLELRLISADMESEASVIHPNYIFSETTKLAFTQDLATQIASITDIKTGSKILIPINIDNQHWVGMSMEFTADNKILINYMDSEGEVIPASLRINLEQQLLETYPNSNIEIIEKEVEQQKYNNCGLEVIENLIAAVAGEAARMNQEDTLAVHSALFEDNLVNEFVSKEAKSEQKTMKIAWKEVQNQQIIERAEEILLEETNNSYISTASKFQHQYPSPTFGGTETVKNLFETLLRFISGEVLPGGKSLTDGITTMQSVTDSVPTPIIAETNLVFDDLT